MYQCRVVHVLLLLRATGVPALRALVQPHLDAATRGPDCRLGRRVDGACTIDFAGGCARVTWSGWETAVEETSCYCPEFGMARRNPCLALAASAARLRGAIRIESVRAAVGG